MKELTLVATLDGLSQVQEFVEMVLEELGCSMKAQMQISIAVEEIYVNIAHYAYPNENMDGKGMATITIDKIGDEKVQITFADYGVPFNPLEKADPDTTLDANERQIGGLGIFMVKKSMDSIAYQYVNGQNILVIEKTL